MLVNITFSLPAETIERLRRFAKLYGRRGTISEIVNAAISNRLEELEARSSKIEFWANRGGKEVARAESLKRLASKLKSRGIDPRDVEIHSSIPIKPLVRMGLRGHAD